MNEVYIPGIGNKPGTTGGIPANKTAAGISYITYTQALLNLVSFGSASSISAANTNDPDLPFTRLIAINQDTTTPFTLVLGTNAGAIAVAKAVLVPTVLDIEIIFYQLTAIFTAVDQYVYAIRSAPNQP